MPEFTGGPTPVVEHETWFPKLGGGDLSRYDHQLEASAELVLLSMGPAESIEVYAYTETDSSGNDLYVFAVLYCAAPHAIDLRTSVRDSAGVEQSMDEWLALAASQAVVPILDVDRRREEPGHVLWSLEPEMYMCTPTPLSSPRDLSDAGFSGDADESRNACPRRNAHRPR